MKRQITVMLICFALSFLVAFIGSWAMAESGDRLRKKADENAPKFMGWHNGERVYFDELEQWKNKNPGVCHGNHKNAITRARPPSISAWESINSSQVTNYRDT